MVGATWLMAAEMTAEAAPVRMVTATAEAILSDVARKVCFGLKESRLGQQDVWRGGGSVGGERM